MARNTWGNHYNCQNYSKISQTPETKKDITGDEPCIEKLLQDGAANGEYRGPSISHLTIRWSGHLNVFFPVVIFILGILIGASIYLSTPHDRSSSGTPIASKAQTTRIIDGIEWHGTQCGNSWQEAKELGCRFDVMASRWYDPGCFDNEVLNEMIEEKPYMNLSWYTDSKHTEIFPAESVYRGEFTEVFPGGNYHVYHCLYLWRKLHSAVLKNRALDEDLLNYEHTLHCTRMIMQWMEPEFNRTTWTTAAPGLPFCRNSRLGIIAI